MAKDEGKNLGYHWRRAAGVYDPSGSGKSSVEDTTTSSLSGLAAPQKAKSKAKDAKKK